MAAQNRCRRALHSRPSTLDSRPLIVLTLVFVVALCAPLCAQKTSLSDVGKQIAKLPTDSVPPPKVHPEQGRRADTPAPPASTEPLSVHGEGEGGGVPTQIAQLLDPTPDPGTAAALIELAREYGWNWDHARMEATFRQVADLYPGTPEAGYALIDLAIAKAVLDPSKANDLISQALATGPNAETEAFASIARDYALAISSKKYETIETVLQTAIKDWRGTRLGGRASIMLGELHRDQMGDYEGAISYYQAAAAAYPDTIVSDEAEVSIADCLNWSGKSSAEAQQAYSSSLEKITSPWLMARAMVGLADVLGQAREWTAAYEVLSELIKEQPNTPSTSLALAARAFPASQLGYFDVAVADAIAFLDTPAARNNHPWIHMSYHVLAQDTFKAGQFQQAEDYFTLEVTTTQNATFKSEATAGIGYCRAARGDPAGAVKAFLQAVELAPADDRYKPHYLFEAATIAQAAGDRTTANQIVNRMVAEYPGSYLTTRLVGAEILPAPDM